MSRLSLRCACAAIVLLSASRASADVVLEWRRTVGGVSPRITSVTETITSSKHREDQAPVGNTSNFSAVRNLTILKEYLLWHQFRLMAVNALVSGNQAAQDADRRRRRQGTAAAPDAYEKAIAKRLEGAQGTPTGATATIAGRRCQEYRYSGVAYDNSFVLAGTYWDPGQRSRSRRVPRPVQEARRADSREGRGSR
ncbi:MAG TPA: hypothetical protein VNJ03_01565 [Vicinamibacterales bacterium]|nr:hypothetical protein [Vicinamibacterales bacterium]